MEIPSLRVQLELQLPAYTTATAKWSLSHISYLHHSSRQHWIPNPLIEARDGTCNLMVPSWIPFHCATTGTPIGKFEIMDDPRVRKIVVNLTGRLNKCGVISPRFDGQLKDLEKWQNKLLPSCQFGFIVLTTSAGIMHHEEVR